jgi:hypothetical protein
MEQAASRFDARVRRAIDIAEVEGLYMPGIVTRLAISLDEAKERFPSDNY